MKANQKLRQSIVKDKSANIEMITMGIIAAVMFAVAVPIIFNVLSSLNTSTVDTTLKTQVYGQSAGANPADNSNASWTAWNNTRPAGNATGNIITQVNSFFSIGPIYLVVVVAVGIISAILVLRRFGA